MGYPRDKYFDFGICRDIPGLSQMQKIGYGISQNDKKCP
jgi:hypothetical protein